ncbi:hypothetical protein [Cohnella luojiensis]|uniref:ParB/Sulfiredoxin domain-containing protein n=1 Tax=Cohnella luojiensis TaxID=652876 RepID=A0A4Y8LMX5_9BACL|nr:hypothetical protein [Cohnella luojiensis]TFE19489.1 hypothetical protein E2980_23140 [Cohnella luojiensis]
MRFTVKYVPLSKIKPEASFGSSKRWHQLRAWMRDCVYLLIVRRNKKDGSFTLLGGLDRYEFLIRHTKKKYAPCIVDESGAMPDIRGWLDRARNLKLLEHFPRFRTAKIEPAGSKIIRSFLRQEPRFARLSHAQKIKVLIQGIRYKRTVVDSMRSLVEEMLSGPR